MDPRGGVDAGQIARLHGLAGVRVGDAFGGPSDPVDHHFPPPTLEASVTAVPPRARAGARAALTTLADQDPLIDARTDDDGQVVVSLYGRVQQEVLAATLAEEYDVAAAFSDASVVHVERPRRVGRALERYDARQPSPRHARPPDRPATTRVGPVLRARRGGHGDAAVPLQEPGGLRHGYGAPRRPRARARTARLAGDRLPGDRDRHRLHAGGRPTVETRSDADRSRLPDAHDARPAPGTGPGRRRGVRAGPRRDPRDPDRRCERGAARRGALGCPPARPGLRGRPDRARGAACPLPVCTSSNASSPT